MTHAFHILLDFAEKQAIYWDFKIRNSVRITKGLDNRVSDNQGICNQGICICNQSRYLSVFVKDSIHHHF